MAEAPFDFEGVGVRVEGLLDLAQWIQRARKLTEDIEKSAELDPAFHTQLKAHGIPYADAWWEAGEHSGFIELLSFASADVQAMAGAGYELQRQARKKS